jgi:hypothetical protein
MFSSPVSASKAMTQCDGLFQITSPCCDLPLWPFTSAGASCCRCQVTRGPQVTCAGHMLLLLWPRNGLVPEGLLYIRFLTMVTPECAATGGFQLEPGLGMHQCGSVADNLARGSAQNKQIRPFSRATERNQAF